MAFTSAVFNASWAYLGKTVSQCCLGHVHHMHDSYIPKDILYGELVAGSRPAGSPMLHYKDVCKWDIKSSNIQVDPLAVTASDGSVWGHTMWTAIQTVDTKRTQQWAAARERRKVRKATTSSQ